MKLIGIAIILSIAIISITCSPSFNSERYRDEELSEYEDVTELQAIYEEVLKEFGSSETNATVTEIRPKKGLKAAFKDMFKSVKAGASVLGRKTKGYFVDGKHKVCKFLYENRVLVNYIQQFCGDVHDYIDKGQNVVSSAE